MPKLRKVAPVRSAKSIAVKVNAKLGGRKSKISTKGLSNEALLKEVSHIKRKRDTNKLMAELRIRMLQVIESHDEAQ